MKNNKEIAQFKGHVTEFQFKDNECRVQFVNGTELAITYREPDGYFCFLFSKRPATTIATSQGRCLLLQDALQLLENNLYIWLTQFHI